MTRDERDREEHEDQERTEPDRPPVDGPGGTSGEDDELGDSSYDSPGGSGSR